LLDPIPDVSEPVTEANPVVDGDVDLTEPNPGTDSPKFFFEGILSGVL
jgi:hypothetical protein